MDHTIFFHPNTFMPSFSFSRCFHQTEENCSTYTTKTTPPLKQVLQHHTSQHVRQPASRDTRNFSFSSYCWFPTTDRPLTLKQFATSSEYVSGYKAVLLFSIVRRLGWELLWIFIQLCSFLGAVDTQCIWCTVNMGISFHDYTDLILKHLHNYFMLSRTASSCVEATYLYHFQQCTWEH